MFCDCSTARAAAHILARPVLGQNKVGIQVIGKHVLQSTERMTTNVELETSSELGTAWRVLSLHLSTYLLPSPSLSRSLSFPPSRSL
jgi:hypothetical protein